MHLSQLFSFLIPAEFLVPLHKNSLCLLTLFKFTSLKQALFGPIGYWPNSYPSDVGFIKLDNKVPWTPTPFWGCGSRRLICLHSSAAPKYQTTSGGWGRASVVGQHWWQASAIIWRFILLTLLRMQICWEKFEIKPKSKVSGEVK